MNIQETSPELIRDLPPTIRPISRLEQLGVEADGGDGIANLMGHAGGHAAQKRETLGAEVWAHDRPGQRKP